MALSTNPYKGTRDFYPEDYRLEKYIFNVWRASAEKFGYEEYTGPLLEPLAIYEAKTGDEIVNEQTYAFSDRGGRQVVIRPEMTPTVSRLVAARRQQLAYPLRLYSIPNLLRYERPQRGRLREHWQLNVDVFGLADISAEFELISLIADIFKSFGAGQETYQIRLNSRQLSDHIFKQYLGISDDKTTSFRRLIDKSAKLEPDEYDQAAAEILGSAKYGAVKAKLADLFAATSVADLPAELKGHPSASELARLSDLLKGGGLSNVRFDVAIMRGLDYYSDIVFEVFDTHPDNNRSMVAGGRYDGLVGLFGVEPVPTAGFGWGDVTMANFLTLHDLLPDLGSPTDVYVALVDLAAGQAQAAVDALRQSGLNVAVDYSGRRLGDQLKTAEKKGLSLVVIIGTDELSSGQLTLKDLASGEESKLAVADIAKRVKA